VITIDQIPILRSFNSIHLEKNKNTGDYSKQGMTTVPNRRIMDKIA
jgi:hypothetical protein